jgi:hypothetical protein
MLRRLFRAPLLTLGLALAALDAPPAHAETVTADATLPSGLAVRPNSVGAFRRIEVTIENTSNASHVVKFDYGTFFDAADESYQDLAVVFQQDVSVAAGSQATVTVLTTCMAAEKDVTSSGYNAWQVKRDRELGDLLRFYEASRPMIETITGPQYHDTQEERHNFLQMLVWAYYGDDPGHVTDFATRYIFNGDGAAASRFVNTLWPLANAVLSAYKSGAVRSFILGR